jgi:hypothetical protein
VIVRCDIVGKNRYPQAGERINLNCSHPDIVGSPLLNEYGDLIGVVGGSLIPGWASTKMAPGVFYNAAQMANPTPGLLAVPVDSSLNRASTHPPTQLEQLAADGTFTPALARSHHVLYGTLARRIQTRPVPTPVEETYEFRSNEKSLVVFLSWQPKEKLKGALLTRILDLSGRLLLESKAKKIDLKPSAVSYYSWQTDISGLKTGIYRVDVLLDSSPAWRAFFNVRD